MQNPSPTGGPPPNLPPSDADTAMDPVAELHARFPRMKPVGSAPPLFRINGCGLSMFGQRGFDSRSGTYLKTYGITLVFIPVLPFACYRVADAPDGGWYFIGREPISGFARMARATLILGVILAVVGVKISADRNSPEGQVKRALAAAAETAGNGSALDAAIQAHDAAKVYLGHADRCLDAMEPYLDEALASKDPRTVLRAVDLVATSPFRGKRFGGRIEGLAALSLAQAVAHVEGDPRLALDFAERARQLDDGASAAWVEPMKAALESLVARPGEADVADVELLAGLYDDLGDTAAVLRLLEPRAPFASGSPLAMRLGRAYLREGRAMEAARHLADYAEARFPEWRVQQERVVAARMAAYDRAIDQLNNGHAPQAFYDAYDKADETERENLVSQKTWEIIGRDIAVKRLEAGLERLGNLPAVMMDLGIARLEAGHAAGPDEREEWFREAEKTFLSLRDHAEDSPDFQFFYGQVCYWLGKSSEGAALFDRLIAEHGEDAALLVEMAGVLRNVGEVKKARDVFQKALDQTGDDAVMRTSCLISLAILAETIDERIGYLEKADGKMPRVAIDLAEARASKAMEDGDRETARTLYRQALDGYTAMPENSTTLNNAALVHFEIANLGGGQAEVAAGLRKMEAALALEPNDSILCHNAASRFLASAANAMLAEAIEPGWAVVSRGFQDLRLLYHDEAGRTEVFQRYTAHPDYQRGRQLLERALVLAPESRVVLMEALAIASQLREADAVANLRKRMDGLAAGSPPMSRDEWLEMVEADTPDDIPGLIGKLNEWHEEATANLATGRAKATLEVRRGTNQISMAHWLPDLEIEPIMAMADDAIAQWPCSEFLDARLSCTRLASWRRLCRERPEVATWAGDAPRMLDAEQLLMLAVLRFPELREDPGVREVLVAGLDYSRRFPTTYTPQDAVAAILLEADDRQEILDAARRHPSYSTQVAYMRMEGPHAPGTIALVLWQQWVDEGQDAAIAAYRESGKGHPWLPELPAF